MRARRVLVQVAERLAVVIASIALVIEPELVVIGGPSGDPALLDPVRSVLAREASFSTAVATAP
ncbi:hypothetical protein [Nonomuraea sp. NPDC052265]|uniref:hypothetical protein n=1 Tax=Nonomuraea sp. NPDC052265 TaxID=3364374 RepID=UPI0037C9D9E9